MSKKSVATASTSGLTMVKVEAGGTVNEIQSYLETFNKEIQGDPNRDSNTYFVDANGQFYYSQRVCVPADEDDEPTPIVVPIDDELQTGVPADTADDPHSVTISADDVDTNAILSSGGQFGTVTIVPSENNGELSYVLFVPTAKQEVNEDVANAVEVDGDDDQDLTVYDFDEEGGAAGEQPISGNESEAEEKEEKPKLVKVLTKKNLQTVSTAHMCNYCNYTSPKRYLLSRHMKSHSEERPHKCSVCERGFKTLASLQNHVNTHTGTKPHPCKFCESTFTTSGELVRHVRYKHTHEKPHRCTECDYASVELSKLKRHVRCHTGERPYQCPHCTYASPDTFKLKRHLRIHTGEKPYECEICHARFTQSNSLKAHRLIHSVADKPVFHCELCPATCGRKTDLRIHVQKLHTSDRMLKCKRCGKSFPDRYQYKVHAKTHEGEKCYKCGLCPYASASARHLESHMLIHTDQKPYDCEVCHQAFRQKQLLRRHQNLYHTPDYTPPPPREKTHECPECGKSFRHKGNLIRHMAIHDPDSESHERSIALKLGRQKKVQYIDGQQIELLSDEEEEEEEEEEEDVMVEPTPGVVVNDSDGQPYVVLEVIQLADGSGTEYLMAANDGTEVRAGLAMAEDSNVSSQIDDDPMLSEDQQLIKVERRDKPEGVDNCFGFGEDEEDIMELEDDDTENKHVTVLAMS